MVGIALSGTFIGGALDADNNDPFYPNTTAVNFGGNSADVCG